MVLDLLIALAIGIAAVWRAVTGYPGRPQLLRFVPCVGALLMATRLFTEDYTLFLVGAVLSLAAEGYMQVVTRIKG